MLVFNLMFPLPMCLRLVTNTDCHVLGTFHTPGPGLSPLHSLIHLILHNPKQDFQISSKC